MVYVCKRRTEIPKLDSSIQVLLGRFAEGRIILQLVLFVGTLLIDGGDCLANVGDCKL